MRRRIEQHYTENYRKLVKIFTNRAGGKPNAEDIVQDAFELALRYRRSFDSDVRPFGTWFNTIINNALRLHKRKDKLSGMSIEYDEELDKGAPLQEWEQDTIDSIKADIREKDFPMRQTLYLYFFRQYKPREITQVLDVSNGYVRTNVIRFKQLMLTKYGGVV